MNHSEPGAAVALGAGVADVPGAGVAVAPVPQLPPPPPPPPPPELPVLGKVYENVAVLPSSLTLTDVAAMPFTYAAGAAANEALSLAVAVTVAV